MRAVLIALLLAAGLAGGAAGCTSGCPTALADGVIDADGSALVLRDETGGIMNVTWPQGWSVRIVDGAPALTDALGSIKARAGDHIEMGGGVDSGGVFRGCGELTVSTPSPSS